MCCLSSTRLRIQRARVPVLANFLVRPAISIPATQHRSRACSAPDSSEACALILWICAQVPYLAYDAITFLQDVSSSNGNNTGLRTVLLDVADVLTGFNVSLAGIVPADTGIFVNLSDVSAHSCHACMCFCWHPAAVMCLVQLFTGSLLSEVESNLNLTDTQQLIDVGKLFQNNVDGSPVVNLTDLVQALPIVSGPVGQFLYACHPESVSRPEHAPKCHRSNFLHQGNAGHIGLCLSCGLPTIWKLFHRPQLHVHAIPQLPTEHWCGTVCPLAFGPRFLFPCAGYEACLASNGHLPPPNAPAGHHHTHTYDPRSDGVRDWIAFSQVCIPVSHGVLHRILLACTWIQR